MIFIIGGNGFVGSAFVRHCEREGREYRVIDRASYDSFVGQSCEWLVNANGNSKKFLSNNEPLTDFEASVTSVRRSLEDFRCDHYVHLSSCDVYADCSSPATTREDTPLDPTQQSTYGLHKALAEACVRHVAEHWTIIRFGGFVGPGLKKNAIFDILGGGPLWLHPESQLQFLDSDVAARLVFELVSGGADREILNLCGMGALRLQDVIDRVGAPIEVKPDASPVQYEISLEKAAKRVAIPETRDMVFDFVDRSLAGR